MHLLIGFITLPFYLFVSMYLQNHMFSLEGKLRLDIIIPFVFIRVESPTVNNYFPLTI
jgi:hypothetical protein